MQQKKIDFKPFSSQIKYPNQSDMRYFAILGGIVILFSFLPIHFALNNGVAKTPPMGWNSWNAYRCNVNETLIQAAADAIIKLGLDKLGYTYVNVDDCWAEGRFLNGTVYP